MTVHGMHREARIEIQASPEAVYDLISDLPRMGEWISENIGGEWQHGSSGKVGDRFLGHNRTSERFWSMPVMVTMAQRGRCFAFVTHPDDGPYVRWTYRLEPSGVGTRVTTTMLQPHEATALAADLARSLRPPRRMPTAERILDPDGRRSPASGWGLAVV